MSQTPQRLQQRHNPEDVDKPLLAPRDIELIRENPAYIEEIARAMGAVNLDNLFRDMQAVGVKPEVRMEFQKLLNRMGRLEPAKDDNAAGGAQVVINITRAKDMGESALTIEGNAISVED